MNALLSDWSTPFSLPPFDQIKDEDFAPAFDAALAEARANIAAIAATAEPPSYANTIEALELAEGLLDRVSGVFYNLAGADSNDAREALMRDLAPKMSAFSSEVTNNNTMLGLAQLDSHGRLGVRRVFDDKFMLADRRWLEQLSDVPGEYMAARIREEHRRRVKLGLSPPKPEDPR